MSSATYGADADELDRLAAAFRLAADELDADGGQLTRLLNNVTWMGDVATRFVGDWTGVRIPQIGLSTRFLREAADVLAANAADQRHVSGAGTGSIGSIAPLPPKPEKADDSGGLDDLERRLEGIGLPIDVITVLLENLAHLDVLTIAQLEGLIDALPPGFGAVLSALDGALDVGATILTMAQDFAAHVHLPVDERLVHAVTVASIDVAVSKGVEAAVTWGLAALGSVVPGIGTGIGLVVGKVVGIALSEAIEWGIDMIDDGLDITDHVADGVVDAYRTGTDVGGAIIGEVGDVIGDVGDVIGDVGDVIGDGIGQLVGGLF
jgi:hypothetical protein